jgi:hypothetical protein
MPRLVVYRVVVESWWPTVAPWYLGGVPWCKTQISFNLVSDLWGVSIVLFKWLCVVHDSLYSSVFRSAKLSLCNESGLILLFLSTLNCLLTFPAAFMLGLNLLLHTHIPEAWIPSYFRLQANNRVYWSSQQFCLQHGATSSVSKTE